MSVITDLARKFSGTNSDHIGQAVEELVSQAIMQRRRHERRWYDNNFFDDGYHFRVISRKTGQVVDHLARNSGYVERAIPRASRQIRGVANLFFAAEPYPVVYPKRITIEQFKDPRTGQIDEQAYTQAQEQAKIEARKKGIWLTTEWEDEQELNIKLIDLILLAAKNSVAYLQVTSDPKTQKIITEVLDAFDVVLYGDRRELKSLPFITKVKSMDFKEVINNPMFDEKMRAKLTPDNRYATSEIKEAYMRARYGSKLGNKEQSSLLVKESFIKEYLNDENWEQAVKLGSDNGAMEGKSRGDIIMRHPFSAGGVTLLDEYVDYDEYPLVDFRFEPGPIYQVPFIERFIPQNKSLDVIVTRLEKWINAMIVGVYQKRKGENFQVSNFPGGQMIEYETTPLTQMQTGSVGNTPFNMVELLNKFIDEQGASTSALAQLPQGVKSGVAIESVKTTEYSNLKISTLMLKKTIKNIAERMLERAHKDILEPQEVSSTEDSEPDYFDVIGQRGYELSKKVDKQLPAEVVVINKDTKIRIEIEPGLGLTMDGKKDAMQSIVTEMTALAQAGYIPQEAMQQVIKRFLETFGYGSTQELMEAMEEGATQGDLTDQQLQKVQIAVLQALKDAGAVGPEMENKLVQSTQVGVLQALKDSGITDKLNTQEPPQGAKESISIAYKDAPSSIKRQMEQAAGFTPATDEAPSETEQLKTHAETIKTAKETIEPKQKGAGESGNI